MLRDEATVLRWKKQKKVREGKLKKEKNKMSEKLKANRNDDDGLIKRKKLKKLLLLSFTFSGSLECN